MIERWLIGIVINFVLRQLAKFKADIDWAKVRSDMGLRVRAIVPGSWFDNEAVQVCNALLDGILIVLGSADALESILTLLAQSKWEEAATALKDLLLSVWFPTGATAKKAKALLV